MKPKKFNEANRCLSKPKNMTDEECSSLWVYNDGEQSISCWKLTFLDRVKLLFHGNVWFSVRFGESQPPVWLKARKTVFENEKDS